MSIYHARITCYGSFKIYPFPDCCSLYNRSDIKLTSIFWYKVQRTLLLPSSGFLCFIWEFLTHTLTTWFIIVRLTFGYFCHHSNQLGGSVYCNGSYYSNPRRQVRIQSEEVFTPYGLIWFGAWCKKISHSSVAWKIVESYNFCLNIIHWFVPLILQFFSLTHYVGWWNRLELIRVKILYLEEMNSLLNFACH